MFVKTTKDDVTTQMRAIIKALRLHEEEEDLDRLYTQLIALGALFFVGTASLSEPSAAVKAARELAEEMRDDPYTN